LWTYFIETYHSYSLPGPRDIGDILKVMGSKVRVTDSFTGGGIVIDSLPIVWRLRGNTVRTAACWVV